MRGRVRGSRQGRWGVAGWGWPVSRRRPPTRPTSTRGKSRTREGRAHRRRRVGHRPRPGAPEAFPHYCPTWGDRPPTCSTVVTSRPIQAMRRQAHWSKRHVIINKNSMCKKLTEATEAKSRYYYPQSTPSGLRGRLVTGRLGAESRHKQFYRLWHVCNRVRPNSFCDT